MNKTFYRAFFFLLFLLTPALQSCMQSEKKEQLKKQQMERRKKRNQDGLRLNAILHDGNLEQALLYVDTLHREYPNDPQFYFAEGWVYDMLEDTLQAHVAYTRSIAIYDSLIAANSDRGDMFNKVMVVQLLYGRAAFNRAIDEVLSTARTQKDSSDIEMWRECIIKKEDLKF